MCQPMTEILSQRALNRALLERQLLIARSTMGVDDTLEHLVGMQAQAPLAPYVGLWSRLEGFQPAALSERIEDRRAVRAMAMLRGTIHLFTARDSLAMRPVLQPVLERTFRGSPFGRSVTGMDVDALLAVGRELLDARPRTLSELARALGERWPDRDAVSLSYAIRYLVPLVQIPPRGLWGSTGSARLAATETWLDRPLALTGTADSLVIRYLRAYGPATVADVGTWSWLTGVREILERLRPQLRTFQDGQGRELFDVPDGPLPDPDTTVPVRFLPEYDNAVLSHSDRTRIVPRGRTVPLPPGNGAVIGTFLVDGMMGGTWRISREGTRAVLSVEPDVPLASSDRVALEAEGHDLVRFSAAGASSHEVAFASPG
jgi:hypothetical protein